MMGADPRELKSLMKRHIQSFIADISPAVSFMRLSVGTIHFEDTVNQGSYFPN